MALYLQGTSAMTNAIPPVREYMSSSPHSIGVDQTLAQAHVVMRQHNIRHLPVLRGGALVGLVSQRDLHLVETLQDVDPAAVTVEEAMSTEVYAVAADTPLDEVASTMAKRRIGCAVVMKSEHVLGIFTTVDACRALAETLRGHDETKSS